MQHHIRKLAQREHTLKKIHTQLPLHIEKRATIQTRRKTKNSTTQNTTIPHSRTHTHAIKTPQRNTIEATPTNALFSPKITPSNEKSTRRMLYMHSNRPITKTDRQIKQHKTIFTYTAKKNVVSRHHIRSTTKRKRSHRFLINARLLLKIHLLISHQEQKHTPNLPSFFKSFHEFWNTKYGTHRRRHEFNKTTAAAQATLRFLHKIFYPTHAEPELN